METDENLFLKARKVLDMNLLISESTNCLLDLVFFHRKRRTSKSSTSSVRMSSKASPLKCLLTSARKCLLPRCQVGLAPQSLKVFFLTVCEWLLELVR